MLLVRTYLAPSPINGMGCFIAEPARAGDQLWIFSPLVDHQFDLDRLAGLPAAVQEFFHKYAYIDPVFGPVLCGDNARFLNHSDTPTAIDKDDDLLIAAGDLAAGTEITSDYRAFGGFESGRAFLGSAPQVE